MSEKKKREKTDRLKEQKSAATKKYMQKFDRTIVYMPKTSDDETEKSLRQQIADYIEAHKDGPQSINAFVIEACKRFLNES